MDTQKKGLFIMALVVSILIGTVPALYAETTSDGPSDKEMKCQRPSGSGPHGMGGGCPGMSNPPPKHRCGGCGADLSSEEIERIKNERMAFHKATRDLRQEIKSKRLALKSELVKKEPNADVAMATQAEISKLSAQLDKEKVRHFLNIKIIAPYATMKCLKGGACMNKGGKPHPFFTH